ncbi:MAG: spore photoproduct lyase family protein [Candidatus Omnitrophota bacterium]
MVQISMFDPFTESAMTVCRSFSDGYQSRRVPFFNPQTIVLAQGSNSTPSRIQFASRICNAYPESTIIEAFDAPHSKVAIAGRRLIDRHYAGKKTLVLGELRDSVRLSQETGNSCPNYWHFSPYGFCPYDCQYCYLAGTIGVKFSPSVKVFVNIDDILEKVNCIANKIVRPTAFYLGKLQDGLALDPLTGFCRIMVPFFAEHPYARLTVLTKSISIENLLSINHNNHTILSWSLNPECICKEYEPNTPPLKNRIEAMQKCAAAGYPIRAMIMPIIPIDHWQEVYEQFITELLKKINLQRITLGGICSYKTAQSLMNRNVLAL